jgi:DNA-binding CsgD family transcriptional regulator
MLALFAAAGDQRPVICVIDDAHWLDSESRDVLAFVARRLQAESTVLLFATRDNDESDKQFAGIASVRLSGLDTQSAVQLLTTAATARMDPYAATRIAAATGGNPLALIDLARDLTIRQLSHLSLSNNPVPLSRQLEAHYLRQVRQQEPDVQRWLLVAAAESTGHLDLIASAAAALGIPSGSAVDAQQAGLVTLAGSIVFRHPLVRSAVYGAMLGAERRHVHAALAQAASLLGMVEVEAWHASESAPGTDVTVADQLEAVAERAAKRGGLVSQARLLARAADHTPPGRQRNDRLLSAAEAAGEAGAAHLSLELLDRIDPEDLDPVQLGRMILARTELSVFIADPMQIMRSPASMLQAANQFNGRAVGLEQKALLRAFEMAFVAESMMQDVTFRELGQRLDAGAQVSVGPYATILRGLSAHALLPYAEAVPLMRKALRALAALDDAELPTFGYVGVIFATALFDKPAGLEYLDRLARIARDAGALRALDLVLWVRSLFELDFGDPAACGQYVKRVRDLRQAIGYEAENVINVAYLAWTGAPRDELELIGEAVRSMGFGGVYTSATTALGIRDIAEGHYHDAYGRLKPVIDDPLLQVTYIRLADFVEAAVRSGHRADATATAQTITMMAVASGSPVLRGLEQRCLALLASDADAEPHYLRAVEVLSAADVPADSGRAHLLYGEWLRRMKRRRDAREQLRAAVEIFDRIESPSFAERARGELAATGEKVSKREFVAGVEMSSQEGAVARMAAEGKTNAEIGAALFISTNTVDYHLRKVFQKLGISSRRQLADRFDSRNTR